MATDKFDYQHKRSSVAGKAPKGTDLLEGQIAVNFPDKALYTKDAKGEIVILTTKGEKGESVKGDKGETVHTVELNSVSTQNLANNLFDDAFAQIDVILTDGTTFSAPVKGKVSKELLVLRGIRASLELLGLKGILVLRAIREPRAAKVLLAV